MLDVSIVTIVMNRTEFLLQSLLTWLKLPVREIIIVDWSSSDPVVNYVKPSEIIKIARVDGKKFYNSAKARNLAVRLSSRLFVMVVDADILAREDLFEYIEFKEDRLYMGSHWQGETDGLDLHTYGTLLIHRNKFFSVNGYNERLIKYGYEDSDLRDRLIWGSDFSGMNAFDGSKKTAVIEQDKYGGLFLRTTGVIKEFARFHKNPKMLEHINHDDISRIINYEVQKVLGREGDAIRQCVFDNFDICRSHLWSTNDIMEKQNIILYTIKGQETLYDR